ncbi:MAG: LCP family protein [Actinobacteria bacterium]|nr:LCP family protein [Actinomycetota bacterium]
MSARRVGSRRTWSQRLIIGFNVCVVIVALGTAAALGYTNKKLSNVQRLALSGALTASPSTPGAPQNILMVGTDSDLGLASGDPALAGRGDVTGARTDTIMILHVDPKRQTARLLSLPRDLWVEIAGQGIHQRINTALSLGGNGTAGPATLIATIKNNFGIPINHYVEVDFAGFENLVRAVGGIPIYFPTGIRDFDPSDGLAHTAINVPGPGCYTLDPTEALAYARSRHMQYQRIPGNTATWTNDNGNDFGRIQRQQDFVRRILERAISRGVRDPIVMNDLVNAGVRSVRMDDGLTAGQIISFGRTFRSFDPADLETAQPPTIGMTINGASVLKLDMPAADAVLAPFRTGAATQDAQLSSITVAVRNGTGRANEATNVAQALQRVGFTIGQPSDELGVTSTASVIRYHAGQEAEARTLARHLRSDVVFEEISGTSAGSDPSSLVLVTGTSFTGVLVDALPAAQVPGPTTVVPTTAGRSTGTTTTTATTTTIPNSSVGTIPRSTVPGFLPGPTPPGIHCG